MSSAIEHAVIASELLDSERRVEDRIANLSPEETMQLAAGGNVKRINADRQFTVELAQAHALTALALAYTGAGVEEAIA